MTKRHTQGEITIFKAKIVTLNLITVYRIFFFSSEIPLSAIPVRILCHFVLIIFPQGFGKCNGFWFRSCVYKLSQGLCNNKGGEGEDIKNYKIGTISFLYFIKYLLFCWYNFWNGCNMTFLLFTNIWMEKRRALPSTNSLLCTNENDAENQLFKKYKLLIVIFAEKWSHRPNIYLKLHFDICHLMTGICTNSMTLNSF